MTEMCGQGTTMQNAEHAIEVFLRKRGFPVALSNSELSLPVSPKRIRLSNKAVSFSSSNHVYQHDYSASDLANSWYQKSDYAAFANECRCVLKETDAVEGDFEKIDHSLFCVRGLEDYVIPSLSYVKQKRRRLMIKMIVREHKIQKGRPTGLVDGESLRVMSSMFSSMSRNWARELGTFDAC